MTNGATSRQLVKKRFYIELNYCKSNYFHQSARVGMSNEYSA